ncbi:cyclase family protein [Novosphingobium mathurense]|uniref:cyclase family protein n=1 Tax=Novosphingobium mathurense TaxID=428990 RepID=UPI001C37DE86|nr:cyclase family protein [Novosphingobium mathurense]
MANPDRLPPRLFAVVGKDGQPIFNRVYRDAAGQPTGVVSDDAALLYTQYSTQWDGFPHFGAVYDADGTGEKVTYYNGWNASSMVPPANRSGTEPWARYEGSHADALGIETMAATGVQGRGVLVDLHAHFGRTPHPVTCADLLGIMEKDRVQVERGDILCLYTGFDRVLLEMGKHPDRDRMFNSCAALDGTDPQLLQWLTDSGVAALASDNRAIEMLPIKPPRKSQVFAPLHEHCLFKIGVHLGEMWYLAELADWLRGHHRNRFFLTAPPLRLTGAVGSPVTPVATV